MPTNADAHSTSVVTTAAGTAQRVHDGAVVGVVGVGVGVGVSERAPAVMGSTLLVGRVQDK
jgi:hypothetical protein